MKSDGEDSSMGGGIRTIKQDCILHLRRAPFDSGRHHSLDATLTSACRAISKGLRPFSTPDAGR